MLFLLDTLPLHILRLPWRDHVVHLCPCLDGLSVKVDGRTESFGGESHGPIPTWRVLLP